MYVKKVDCEWEDLGENVNRILSTHKKKDIGVWDIYSNPESMEEYVKVTNKKQYLSNGDLS